MKKMNKKIILASALLGSFALINTASARSNVSFSLNVGGFPPVYNYGYVAPVIVAPPPPVYYRPQTTIIREERYISPTYIESSYSYRPAYVEYPSYREKYRHRRWIEKQRDREYYERQRDRDDDYNRGYGYGRNRGSLINSGI